MPSLRRIEIDGVPVGPLAWSTNEMGQLRFLIDIHDQAHVVAWYFDGVEPVRYEQYRAKAAEAGALLRWHWADQRELTEHERKLLTGLIKPLDGKEP